MTLRLGNSRTRFGPPYVLLGFVKGHKGSGPTTSGIGAPGVVLFYTGYVTVLRWSRRVKIF